MFVTGITKTIKEVVFCKSVKALVLPKVTAIKDRSGARITIIGDRNTAVVADVRGHRVFGK